MTEKREQALRNAVASAQMEELVVTKQTEHDCIRYLEGKINTETFARKALNRCRAATLNRRNSKKRLKDFHAEQA